MPVKIASVQWVFWSLLVGSFVMAVVGATVAMWMTLQPLWEQSAQESAGSIVVSKAIRIQRAVEPVSSLVEYLASDPTIVSLTDGHFDRVAEVAARLEQLRLPRTVERFEIFGSKGQHLVNLAVASPAWMLFDPDLSQQVAQTTLQRDRFVHHWEPEDTRSTEIKGQLLIARPLRFNDQTVGVLVAWMDMTAILRGEVVNLPNARLELVNSGEFVFPNEDDTSTKFAPIGSTGLTLSLTRVGDGFSSVGQELAANTSVAVMVSLILPFLLFGFLGRRAILRPHLALETSQTKLREKQKELSELAAIARKAEEAIIVTDLDSKILWVNPAFERMSGFAFEAVKGRVPGHFLQGPETDPETIAQVRRKLAKCEAIEVEILNYSRAGKGYWVRLSISPLYDDAGQAYGFSAISSDVSERRLRDEQLKHAREAIERQAFTDELTGLANRRFFNSELERVLGSDGSARVSVLRIDLDHFKNVNDTMGHEAGDHVLCTVADILTQEVRDGELAVRVGGDEFIVLISLEDEEEPAIKLAERLRRRIRQPIAYGDASLQVGASFGIATTRASLVPPADLVRAADAALYVAKDKGRNKVILYDTEIHNRAISVRAMAESIRRGLARGEFVPFYQLQVDALTHDVVGMEVLARWKRADGTLIGPDGFLGVAAQLSLLSEIDEAVTSQALTDVHQLEASGIYVPKVSFNVTSNRLTDPALVAKMCGQNFKNTLISFEILESVLLDEKSTQIDFALDLMREKGLTVEIDDFGSGHASMISLIRVRPEVLKIDQRLVFGAPESDVCLKMVQAIVEIANSLGISVTAEGVETEIHADLMRDLGCATLQGYHFARPVDFDGLSKDLKTRRLSLPPAADQINPGQAG